MLHIVTEYGSCRLTADFLV